MLLLFNKFGIKILRLLIEHCSSTKLHNSQVGLVPNKISTESAN